MKKNIALFILLYTTSSLQAMLYGNKLQPHIIIKGYAKTLSTADRIDIGRLYYNIKKVGNYDCSQAYVTKKQCLNSICCKDAFCNGIVAPHIRDNFFENIQNLNPVTLVDTLKKNTHELRVLNGYARWKFISSHKDDWAHYQQIFGLIAHKSRCILQQLHIMYQNAPADWDERTYHHLGKIKYTEMLLQELIEINQYAQQLTREAMRGFLIEELERNRDHTQKPFSQIIKDHLKDKKSQLNPCRKE